MEIKSAESSLPLEEEITDQLDRMLSSPDFHVTPQQTAFIKYVVEKTQEGKAESIKGYTVATEVFGRRSDFDQSMDPIVSIQASRLRLALERYYETAGKNDPIRIDIPKGTFVPVFEKIPHTRAIEASIDREHPDINVKSTWPSVLIKPLRNLSDDSELDFWGIGLATDLADELTNYPDIRVMTFGSANPNTTVDQSTVHYVVDGTVRSDRTSIKMVLKLTDTRTGHQIWSESSRSSIEASKFIAFQEDLARSIAVKIAGKRGLIMRTLVKESKSHQPKHSTVIEAALRFFKNEISTTPETFSQALAALEKAVIIDPEYGPTWSMLARLYSIIYANDIPGFKDPLKKAIELAQTGRRLSPANRHCRIHMAYIHLLCNDLKAGMVEAERALQLAPRALYVLDVIGYVMTLLGDWERGPALIEKVIQLNPFYHNVVHYGLWLNYLRQGDYVSAHQETLKLNRPALFWDHIARASSLGLIGNIKDGRKSATELLKLKPDFTERGGILIRHFIKFEDIVERVIEGLKAVGVEVR